jgi:phospholipid/cholesterol/gamma-HCH transport system permease protein
MAGARMAIDNAEEEWIVRIEGALDITDVGALWKELKSKLQAGKPSRLVVDCSGITGIDTAGIAFFRLVETACAKRNISFTLRGMPPAEDAFVRYVNEHATPQPKEPPSPTPDLISRVGRWGEKRLFVVRDFTKFTGDCAAAAFGYLRHPTRVPRREILFHLQSAGPDAVPLVLLLGALMGMIMVFQGVHTVQSFGSSIYIADVVVLGVTREMAPLLTAVILAGRSGAAFAAEIGSMKIAEEIDALTVMNVDIPSFIVLPRLLALIVAGPLLTILADAAGIMGGLLTSFGIMGLPPIGFIQETSKALADSDIYTGLIKGTVFATLVGMIGCFCGLRTEGTTTGVGVQATAAVVHSILNIVLADTYLVAFFNLFGWVRSLRG